MLIGKLTVSVLAVLPAPLHYDRMQMLKTRALLVHKNYETEMLLDVESKEELQW